MADRNRNWNDQYNEDWNQNRNWRNEENDYRPTSNYGSSSYNRNEDDDYQGRNRWSGSGRESSDRYSNTGNQYNSPYESRNRGYNQNQQQHTGYSSQAWRNEDRNRNEGWGSAGMYGGDFGREDWEQRSNMNYGGNRYGQQNRNWQDSNYGGYSPGFNQNNRDYNENRGYSGNRDRDYRNSSYDSRRSYENRGRDDRGWWDRTRDEVSSWFGDDDAERRRNMDKQYSEGGYRGKGPKDYKRSSDRIREDVCDRLSDDDRLDATNIQVQVEGTDVVLTGTVNDRYQKRYAEDLVESISGVHNVENRLKVGSANLASHNYTGNSEHFGGVGDESGTTNEIIRNVQNERSKSR